MTSKNKIMPNVKKMSEHEIEAFVKLKKECDSRAYRIVVHLCETTVSAAEFLHCLPFISQSHYDDVTVERAITNMCGYPLCNEKLPDKIPKQTFKIDRNTNTVYDITEKKNFCSPKCYTASCHIQKQLLTSPLWFREKRNVQTFNLLSSSAKNLQGKMIDISLTEKIKDTKSNFTSLMDFTKASLDEIDAEDYSSDSTIPTSSGKSSDVLNDNLQTDNSSINNSNTSVNISNDSSQSIQETVPITENISKTKKSKNIIMKNKPGSKILGNVVEKKIEESPILIAKHNMNVKLEEFNKTTNEEINSSEKRIVKGMSAENEHLPGILLIEKSFNEWFSFDTLFFIFGETKLKELVADKTDKIKEHLEHMMNKTSLSYHTYSQYEKLCKKLNLMELEDRKYDEEVMDKKELKPLPNYSMLKEDGKLLNIKVKNFFKGELTLPKNTLDSDDDEDEDEEMPPNIPLNEKTSQHILRRKIFLNGLDKVLPDMLKALCIPGREISGDIRQLVSTFNLQPHNVVFKNAQWNLIAIIIIKLLSIKNQRLNDQLNTTTSSKHLQLLIMSYKLDFGYIDRLLWWLIDVERIVKDTNV